MQLVTRTHTPVCVKFSTRPLINYQGLHKTKKLQLCLEFRT